MSNLKCFLLVCVISLSTCALSSETVTERFVALKEEGILNPKIPNAYVIETIREGVQSSNTDIVNLSIQALARYTDFLILGAHGPYGSIPERSFAGEDRLKSFLINRWETGHAASGFDATKQLEFEIMSIISNRPPELEGAIIDDQGVEKLDGKALSKYVRDQLSTWLEIPRVLCALWPGDKDIHALIWRYHENDRNVSATSMLSFLNIGKFKTVEANEYRIKQLVEYGIEDGIEADIAISMAARGLALSHPEAAIQNLVQAGFDHIVPRSDILITLSGYTDSQLEPYYSKLVSLVSVGKPDEGPISQELKDALNRLVIYTQGSNPWRDKTW